MRVVSRTDARETIFRSEQIRGGEITPCSDVYGLGVLLYELVTGVVPFEPFLVNLADKEASRFLRVTLRLVVDTEDEAKEIEESKVEGARARSAILELLATQESSTLITAEGKIELKKLIAERTSAVLKREIRDVLFTDFVVQF